MPRGSPGLNSGIYHVKPDLHWNRPGFQSWKPFAKTGYPKAWLDFRDFCHQNPSERVYSISLNKLTNITEGVSTWICSSRVFLSSAIRARISLRRTSKAHEAGDFMCEIDVCSCIQLFVVVTIKHLVLWIRSTWLRSYQTFFFRRSDFFEGRIWCYCRYCR